jgi:dienelactone hydrolase
LSRTLRIRISLLAVLVAARWFLCAQTPSGDEWLTKPVDDRTYRTYLDFFVYDNSLPFGTQSIDTSVSEGLRREHLSFQGISGDKVFANLYSPEGIAFEKTPALILLHGGTAKGKDSRYAVALAEVLARAGFIVLAIDMLYFGERNTALLTKFTEAEKHDRLYNQKSAYLAWITQLVKDVGRSVDFLVRQRKVDARHVGLFGISRGAEAGTVVAGADRRLTPVVLFYGGHYDALETEHLPAACPANYIGRISPRPLLMINGEADSDFDKVTAVDPLYARARQPKEIIWTEAGHMGFTDKEISKMTEWLRDHAK